LESPAPQIARDSGTFSVAEQAELLARTAEAHATQVAEDALAAAQPPTRPAPSTAGIRPGRNKCTPPVGPDLIVEHVRDCDLVNGSGNPIGDPR
jgi:hypothetical protein